MTFWETEEAMQASDVKARQLCPPIEGATGRKMQAVDAYEVLLFEIAPDLGGARG
jgi:hypothetical protein